MGKFHKTVKDYLVVPEPVHVEVILDGKEADYGIYILLQMTQLYLKSKKKMSAIRTTNNAPYSDDSTLSDIEVELV